MSTSDHQAPRPVNHACSYMIRFHQPGTGLIKGRFTRRTGSALCHLLISRFRGDVCVCVCVSKGGLFVLCVSSTVHKACLHPARLLMELKESPGFGSQQQTI